MKSLASRMGGVFSIGFMIIGMVVGFAPTAQGADQPPPVRSLIDANGVNLIDGSFNYAGAVMGWSRDSLMGTINSSGTTYTVSLGAMSRTYSLSGGIFTPLQGDGSTLVQTNSTTYTWTLRDGTKAVFSTSYTGSYGNNIGISGNVAQIVQLMLPSGEVDTYSYTIRTIDVPVPPPYPPLVYYIARLDGVTNNFGYEIKYLYQGNGTLGFSDLFLSYVVH